MRDSLVYKASSRTARTGHPVFRERERERARDRERERANMCEICTSGEETASSKASHVLLH